MNRELRLASMQTAATGTVSANTITLPDNCRAIQSLRINIGGVFLEIHPLPPERLADTLTTSYPVGYVTVGTTLNLIGGSGTPGYAMTYWLAIPALSDTDTNNWLLTREPGAYLYGALLEASPYLGDNASAKVWAMQYQDIIAAMQAEDDRARYGNSPSIGSPIRNCP